MTDLREFLLARISEEERTASIAAAGPGCGFGDYELAVVINPPRGTVEASPGRILTECQVKRRILGEHSLETEQTGWNTEETYCRTCRYDGGRDRYDDGCPTILFLALPYADHPDYDQEWKP